MPLLTFSINTGAGGFEERIQPGMEVGGVFVLRHVFSKIPHPETEFTIKQICVDSAGDARGVGGGRGERHTPAVWVGIEFPHLDHHMIVSRRDTYSRQRTSDDHDNTIFPDVMVANDTGLLRFPITHYPVHGLSNRHDRNGNSITDSHHTFYGMHNCNIPLGKMKLKDNVLEIRITPRDYLQRTYFDTADRINRFRAVQIILEYI